MTWLVVHVSQLSLTVFTQLFPEFQFKWLVDEINANLPYELGMSGRTHIRQAFHLTVVADFLHEARNCKKLASLFKGNKMIVTPLIHDV